MVHYKIFQWTVDDIVMIFDILPFIRQTVYLKCQTNKHSLY